MGMKKLRGFTGTHRKQALTEEDLHALLDLSTSNNLDDLVFNSIVFSLFHALLRLGETTQSDNPTKCSFRKVTLHHSVKLTPSTFSLVLPTHKADHFYEGSTILIESRTGCLCPHRPFVNYLTARDARFPLHAPLWLRSTGDVPTYSWVVSRLKHALGTDVAGHSLRSGGATTLALAGTPDDHIQAHGRWSSNAYHVYIRKHPIMMQSLLHGHSAFDLSSTRL